MEIIELFSDFNFKDWFSLGFASFLGIALLFYEKFINRKKDRESEQIFDFVSKFKEKDTMEETLKGLKEQQKNIEQQLKKHIPELAKQSVLYEQLVLHEKALYSHYKEWTKINKELSSNSEKIKLKKELEDKVLNLITPKYEVVKKLDDIKMNITLSSIIIAISSVFVVSPINAFIAIPFLMYIGKNLYSYLKLKGISEDSLKNDAKFLFDCLFYSAIGFICLIGFSFGYVSIDYMINHNFKIKNNLFYLFGTISIILILFSFYLNIKKEKLYESLKELLRKEFHISE